MAPTLKHKGRVIIKPKFLTVYLTLLLGTQIFATTKHKNEPTWNKALEESADRKEGFVRLLLPIIDEQNRRILQDREFVYEFFATYETENKELKIQKSSYDKLIEVAKAYKIQNIFDKKEYLEKIDEIPASLALSQAALESGWGSSRVTKGSNNFFGQKAFGAKKYLKAKGSSIKYAAFDTIGEAVRSYMTNLNSHEAYKEFRKKRALDRAKNNDFTGIKAAKTLINYSEVNNYTAMLTSIIKSHFAAYDKTKNTPLPNALKAGFM